MLHGNVIPSERLMSQRMKKQGQPLSTLPHPLLAANAAASLSGTQRTTLGAGNFLDDAPHVNEEMTMADEDSEKTDLKLALLEQTFETRLVGLDAKLDKLFAQSDAKMDKMFLKSDAKMDRLFDKMETMSENVREAKVAAQEAKSASTNVKWNILFASLGTVAILLAVWALWAQGIEMIATLLSTK